MYPAIPYLKQKHFIITINSIKQNQTKIWYLKRHVFQFMIMWGECIFPKIFLLSLLFQAKRHLWFPEWLSLGYCFF